VRTAATVLLLGVITGCALDRAGQVDRRRRDAGSTDAGGVDAPADALPPDAPPADVPAAPDAPRCTVGERACDGSAITECRGDPPAFDHVADCDHGCSPGPEAHCLRVAPSNVPADMLHEPTIAGELVLMDGWDVDTSDGEVRERDTVIETCDVVTQPGDAPDLCVLSAERIVVGTGEVDVFGDRALVLLGRDEVVVEGVLDADGNSGGSGGPAGGDGGDGEDQPGDGDGGGAAGGTASSSEAGGGGGGFGGAGGRGAGDRDGTPGFADGGEPYPCSGGCDGTLSPLVGGSGGGAGGGGVNGGGGGGAVQLASARRIRILGTGRIDLGGGGGGAGDGGGGGGGGSGGAALLEAPEISIAEDGVLAANGGGGGGRDSETLGGRGTSGRLGSSRASGGDGDSGDGVGGAGGAGAELDGLDGTEHSSGSGGGGGGVGRIRLNVLDPGGSSLEVDESGIVSPALGTAAATVGPLAFE